MAPGGKHKSRISKRKGWWTRFLERLAQANQEALKKQSCPT